ncbi:hypothetical protein HYV12_00390 [Candidatus Dojkabacteria bacterium]|nr:hypothetical protein [Candidatus Dojkabacteria bacterium]
MYRKIVFTIVVFITFLLSLFSGRLLFAGYGSGVCGGATEYICEFTTDDNGNTTQTCHCSDGSGGGTCGPGTYRCNRGCCDIGSGTPVENDPPPTDCDPYRVNCPPGTVRSNQVASSACVSKGLYNDCGSGGNAQVKGSCCSEKEFPGGCEEVCGYKKGGSYVCRQECEEPSYVCNGWTLTTYRCIPVIPPVTINYSLINSTSALGCTVTSGYVGKTANNTVRVSAATPNTFSGNNLNDVRVWFGNSPTTISAFNSTASQALVANNKFGIVVKKVAGVWSDIYAPSKYTSGSTTAGSDIQSWVKIGTIGTGQRGIIKGRNGRSLASISNVSVTVGGTNTTFTFDISFYNNESGISGYETALSGKYNIHGAGRYGTADIIWTPSTKSVVLDLTAPTNDSLSFSYVGGTKVDLAWAFTDTDPDTGGNSLIKVIGNAAIDRAGKVNGPISNLTSPQTIDYVLGSGGNGPNVFTGTPNLWVDSSRTSRSQRIDVKLNEGGSLNFFLYAFDKACNATRSSVILPLGEPWLITKAGVAYSKGGSAFTMQDLAYTSQTERLSNDTYWSLPFAFYKYDAELSTEVLASGSNLLNELIRATQIKSGRILNKADSNNKVGYWFDSLSERAQKQMDKSPTTFSKVTITGDLTLPTDSRSTSITDGTNTCTAANNCIVEVAGNLVANIGFVCDARTLFLVTGTTTIHPDLTASSSRYGCMFVNKGNVNITAGSYKSAGATYPKYDIVNSFVISDGIITLDSGDSGLEPKDGLKIVGSLIGFNNEGSRSVVLDRSLTLMDANSFPSAAIHFDNRYVNFGALFFGGNVEGYKSEVGFKPL